MGTNKIIAVFGSPSSGKTLTSTKLGLWLASKKNNCIIVLSDFLVPMLPVIYPKLIEDKSKSLGSVLASSQIASDVILSNLITDKKHEYLSFLGYRKGENALSHAQYSVEKAIDLLIHLRYMCDYVIVDCVSEFTSNNLTIAALKSADKTLSLCSSDLKGLTYFSSQMPLLMDRSFGSDRYIKIVSNVRRVHAFEEVKAIMKDTNYNLPYDDNLEVGFASGNLFCKGKTGYEKELSRLMAEVISIE